MFYNLIIDFFALLGTSIIKTFQYDGLLVSWFNHASSEIVEFFVGMTKFGLKIYDFHVFHILNKFIHIFPMSAKVDETNK